MAVIKGSDESDRRREQHPVPEHITGHIADADHRDRIRVDVDAKLDEVAPHRFPRTAGSDPERLVVVPRGAAGSEGIIQPESVFDCDGIGGV